VEALGGGASTAEVRRSGSPFLHGVEQLDLMRKAALCGCLRRAYRRRLIDCKAHGGAEQSNAA
jgi:hypothetical protein